MAKIGPLDTPFSRDPFPAPSAHEKFGVCTEGNPDDEKQPGDDTSVLGIVLYTKTDGLSGSPAALSSPMGTAIPNTKFNK